MVFKEILWDFSVVCLNVPDLVEDFIKKEIGESHAYQWAIHTPKAALEKGEQPHAHIMYSERTNDGLARDPEQYFKRYNAKAPERGGCHKDSAGTEERLQQTRQRWAEVQNQHLERHGHDIRVDHRSLKQQGIDREPEHHLGGVGVRKLNSEAVTAILERRAAEGEQERSQQEVSIIDLSGDLEKAKQEAGRRGIERPGPAINSMRFDVQRQQAERKRREAQQKAEREARQQAQLDAQRQQAAQKVAREQQQQRIERMTSAELREEIKRLQPQNVQQVAMRQPEVSGAWSAHKLQTEQWNQASDAARQAGREMAQWRNAHPLQAKAHDAGFKQAKCLAEREQIKADQEQTVLRLGPRVEDSRLNARHLQSSAEQSIRNEQAPLRQAIEALERIQQLKAAQEQAEQRQNRAVDNVLKSFQDRAAGRALKAYGYDDSGKHWQAMPEAMKKMIEDYNRLPREGQARPIVLERIRENLKRDPEMVERMTQQLERARDHDHGHSHGY